MEIFRLSLLLVVLVASAYAAPSGRSKVLSKIVRKLVDKLKIKDVVKDVVEEIIKEVLKEVVKEEMQGQEAKRGVAPSRSEAAEKLVEDFKELFNEVVKDDLEAGIVKQDAPFMDVVSTIKEDMLEDLKQAKRGVMNCYTRERWTKEKTDWCCKHKNRGCPACAALAAPAHGSFFCKGNICHLECEPGFAAIGKTVTSHEGDCKWSDNPAGMACDKGVALIIGGLLDAKGVEVLGPMKDGKPACHYRIEAGLPDTRVGSTLDLVDGNLLACGGSMIKGPPIPPFPPARDNCIKMNMEDHTWQHFATMHTGRDVHSHVAMLGKLILIGGTDKPTSMDVLTPGKSKEFTEYPIPKTKYSCVAKISPTEYIITGGTYASAKAYKVNVITRKITPLADLLQERSGHGCAYVEAEGMKGVIIAGGLPQGNTKWTTHVTSKTSAVTEFYDLKTGKWTRMGDLHTARRGIRLLFVGGTLYSFGGFNGERYTEFVESFDFKTKKWIEVEPMLAARAFPSVAVVPEKLFKC